MPDSERTSPDPQPSPEVLPAIRPVPVNESSDQQATDEPQVSSPQHLLAKIECLAGFALAGLVPTARVNAAHGCLRTVLQNRDGLSATPGAGVLQDDDALKILRDGPELLELLKPVLTPDQIKLIIREAPLD